MLKDDFTIKVPGTNFEIHSNSIYEIVSKLDTSAPDEFKRLKTTKVIDPDLTTSFTPPFNAQMGVWDLGFEENSPCLFGIDKDLVKKHLVVTQNYIVGPVERIKGKGYLNAVPKSIKHVVKKENEGEGLDYHKITLGLERIFDTKKPLDLLDLYLAVLAGELAPKDEEFSRQWDNADFSVENKREKTDQIERAQYKKDRAVAKMHTFLEDNKKYLVDVLNYVGVKVSEKSTDQTISSFFRKWLDNTSSRSGENAEYFLGVIEKFTKQGDTGELYTWSVLNDLVKNGAITIRKNEYFLDGQSLGHNLRTVAEQTLKDKKLKEAIFEKALLSAD